MVYYVSGTDKRNLHNLKTFGKQICNLCCFGPARGTNVILGINISGVWRWHTRVVHSFREKNSIFPSVAGFNGDAYISYIEHIVMHVYCK